MRRRSADQTDACSIKRCWLAIGNIQATEALFFARVDPQATGKFKLSRQRNGRFWRSAIDRTLQKNARDANRVDDHVHVEEAGREKSVSRFMAMAASPAPELQARRSRKMELAGRGTVYCQALTRSKNLST